MIIEQVVVTVKAEDAAGFEAAVETARTQVLNRAQGFRGLTLHRCIEDPARYLCVLTWETLEDHTETFRGGPLFTEWRGLVGAYFATPPEVLHYSA